MPDYTPYEPQIAAPAKLRRNTFEPPDWQAGAIVRAPNWLGDTMMCIPAAHALRKLMPADCELSVLAPAAFAPIWEATGWVDRVIRLRGRRATGSVSREIRSLNAGVAVVFPNSFGSALDVFFKGIPVRVGRGGRGRALLLTGRGTAWRESDREAHFHQVSHYFDVVGLLGDTGRELSAPPLVVADAAGQASAAGLVTDSGLRLALAPGAAYGPAKQWPVERFTEVAREWESQGGATVVLGTERERPLGETVCAGSPRCQNLCGATTLSQLMAVLSLSTACVANDSGTMHLAAALGVNGVGIFGSTNLLATGPLGGRWILLSSDLRCAPCFDRICEAHPRHDYACLRQTSAESVVAAIRQLTV